eukprot:3304348-Amphidinium_carterae.2
MMTASGSNIAHIEKANSLKRKMAGEARGKQKKQGDIINNFHNVKIGNYYAGTSSSSTDALKRTSKTADDTTPATPRAPRTSTPWLLISTESSRTTACHYITRLD